MSKWFAIGYQRTDYYQWEPPETGSAILEGIEAPSAREARLIALRSAEFKRQVADDRSDGVNPLASIVIGAEPEHVCPYDDPPEDMDEANALTCPVCDAVWKKVYRRLDAIEERRNPNPVAGLPESGEETES